MLKVGNGTEEIVNADEIQIQYSMNIPFVNDETSIDTLINFIFLEVNHAASNRSVILNQDVLLTINNFVHEINHKMIQKFLGIKRVYFSHDEVLESSPDFQDQDLLHLLKPNGLSLHELTLKKNFPIMLL